MRVTNQIDKELGSRLRQARILANLTQDGLAQKVNISFQQIQKYENGSNRISASRLEALARVLNKKISFFYDGLPDASPKVETDADIDLQDRTLRIARIFETIPDGAIKDNLYGLIKSCAKETGHP